jgi:hypothetical protein
LQSVEVGQWRDVLYSVKPGDNRSDLQITAASDPVLDSSRTLLAYYACGGRISAWRDQGFTDKLTNVLGLSGDARSKGFQELWQTAYDQNVFIPLFGLNYIHDISPKLHCDPRLDGVVNFNRWMLDR